MATRFTLTLIAILAFLGLAGPAFSQDQALIERGRYIADAGHCVGCHTAQDGKPYAGGRAMIAPQGTIYSANITPDQATGIGGWTADQLYRALHQGRARRGHLYPAMPYNYFTKVTRADADALFAYLRTVPAVPSTPPKNQMPFPYNIRSVLVFWNALNFKAGEYRPDPARTEAWNRGAYLVEGLGHCGGCHTPIDGLGAPIEARFVQGNVVEDWFAPDITSDRRRGIGAWDRQEVVRYLKTGRNARDVAVGPMAEVIRESTSRLTDADLTAIAAYLADLPASVAPPPSPAADPAVTQRGRALYVSNCGRCHGLDGSGQPGFYPALAGHNGLQQVNALTSIRTVLQGSRGPSVAGQQAMPAFARLSDDDIAAILTYARGAWGNEAAPVGAAEVTGLRGRLAAAN